MILVVGGRASGKRTYIQSLGFCEADMADGVFDERPVLLNLQALFGCQRDSSFDACELAADQLADCENASKADAFIDLLASKQVVSCCEIGNGIVPLDAGERAWRERVGRTVNALADRADSVVRMVCGLPVKLK